MVLAIVLSVIAAVVVLAAILLPMSMRIVKEYERAVFFRLGHVRPEVKGPGVIWRAPGFDRVLRVTLRVEVIDIPPQSVITSDNVTVQVDAVCYFQVLDPVKAVIGVEDFRFASQRVAMTSLRSIIGRHELDDLLAHRENLNNELRTVIATSTQRWGVDVRQVEIRDVLLPAELTRAMAKQAEAERERRAKVIAATGELEASTELSDAAAKLYESPGALQLRALQTLAEVATEKNSTLIFPIPVELLGGYAGPARAATPGDHGRVTASTPAGEIAGQVLSAIAERATGGGGIVPRMPSGGERSTEQVPEAGASGKGGTAGGAAEAGAAGAGGTADTGAGGTP